MTVTFAFAAPGPSPDAVQRTLTIVKQRIASQKLSGATAGVSTDGKGVAVQGPAADKAQLELLGRAGVLEFRPVLASSDASGTASAGTPPQGVSAALWQQLSTLDCKSPSPTAVPASAQIVACQSDGLQKFALDATAVSGTTITAASAASGSAGTWLVNVTFTSAGAAQFGQLTTRLAGTGSAVAITVDGIVDSAPSIQEPVTDGVVQITGQFDQSAAQSLAATLQSGALPAALTVQSVTG